MRILITGSRDWTNAETIRVAILDAIQEHCEGRGFDRPPVIVHGGARGADTIADGITRRLGFETEVHPADWARYGKSAGHRRNAVMVALGADVCLAFPLGKSDGTRGCMRMAEAAGIPVISHEPASRAGARDASEGWGPTMRATIARAMRYTECHEEVRRRGELQPCNMPAVAVREDVEGGGAYPVCAFHSRSPMVPLADLLAAAAE